MIHRRHFALLLGGFATVTLTEAVAADPKTVDVTMTYPQGRFVPATVNIAVGDTVKWINPTSTLHTVTFDPSMAANPTDAQVPAGVAPFDSGDIAEDGTFSHSFSVKGTYKYFCGYHETMGMVGTVVVS
jgi:plastocyanin